DVTGIGDDAFHRAHGDALRLVEMPDAFRAQRRIDDVVLLALRDRAIGAHGLADVAIDAGVGDLQGHRGILAPATKPHPVAGWGCCFARSTSARTGTPRRSARPPA